jgi:hypothetical protein
MRTLSAFFTGALFGLGLLVSGMAQPDKVLGFLDVFGTWDPSLAFVMGGALLVTHFGFRWITGRDHPVFAGRFALPTTNQIDSRLVAGASLFGIGWGLVGYCPGPALVAVGTVQTEVLIFAGAMFVGFFVYEWLAPASPDSATGNAANAPSG